MNRTMGRVVWSSLLVLLLSCGLDDRPATWSYVHEAIIEPNCTQSACHSSLSAAFGIKLTPREDAYTALTGRICNDDDELPTEPDRNFVDPGDPARSKLMYLLRGDEVGVMPPDLPLPDRDIELVEEWILLGAPCD